jgi:hypothetical protein
LLFWAFINKTLLLSFFGYYYCCCSLDLSLGRFGFYFFKEGAPLALGPTIGSLVEFWVQLSYPLKFSTYHNQSRCGKWHSTPSQLYTLSSKPFLKPQRSSSIEVYCSKSSRRFLGVAKILVCVDEVC